MIPLNINDPYPKLVEGAHTYIEEQEYSARVDAWLGLETERIEKELTQPQDGQFWIGLPVQAMLTPYTEIRAILEHLNPASHSTLIDLGAGYGRMGFVIGCHYPQVKFIGYEIIEARVRESLRCLAPLAYPLIEMHQADLSASGFKLPAADFYFIYDFGSRQTISKTLEDLKIVARSRPIKVVARGGLSRNLIDREHPWLSQVHPPRHFHHYSIYTTY